LIKWSSSQRLVSSDDPRWIAESLIADSLLFLKALPDDVRALLDVGSGAGFPGIPIKIVHPEISVTLLDSRQRRASFLRAVVRGLQLTETEVVDRRLESLSSTHSGVFDVAVMRCAGNVCRMLPLTLPLLRPGGLLVSSGPPAGEAARCREIGRRDRAGLIREQIPRADFERVMVAPPGGGPPRQFLVARKS
jgi:16S rRNA (guanine527-N7)-methyltransferase